MQCNIRGTFPRGFTLLEVMVVIGIIGLMATMIVPATIGQLEKSKVKKTQSDLKAMKAALDMYAVEAGRGKYPANSTVVTYAMENQGITWNTCRDGWDKAYEYYRNSDGTRFYLVSPGSNGSLGGSEGDDIYATEKQNPLQGSFVSNYGEKICSSN